MSQSAPQDRTPNLWFDLRPHYSGPASICFGDGQQGTHVVEGTACCSYSESTGNEIAFECKDIEEGRKLEHEYWHGTPGVMAAHGPRRPSAITLRTAAGSFTANYKILWQGYTTTIGDPHVKSKATFRSIGATFAADNTAAPAHFVMPLYNMLSPAFETWPKPQHETINNHRLRIFPTPPQLADGEDQINRNWHNRLISFRIDNEIGFIEPLPDYAERARQLRDGTASRLITAILVCDATTRDCRSDESESWFPIDLLNLLSLATGRRVGAPWLEYRDKDGVLSRRIHVAFGVPTFKSGHPIVMEDLSPNSGYIITQGMQSPTLSTKLVRLMINHLINAGLSPSSIENRFLSLCRALEGFATDRGLSTQDIKAGLDPATSQSVTSILAACAQSLNVLAGSISDAAQKKSVNRVADRARGADQRDKNFGAAVADVATHMGFDDRTALLNGFAASNGNNWCAFLSFLRGAVVHEGGFDVVSGVHDALEIVRVTDHLHDLLIRIVCKLLGSVAPYSSTIYPRQILRELDWVKANTAASDLIAPY